MKRYVGTVTPGKLNWRVRVLDGVRSYPLDSRTDLRNHSPDGLAWGYQGSGPAQCALAILADVLDAHTPGAQSSVDCVLSLYCKLCDEMLQHFPKEEGFELKEETVRGWLAAHGACTCAGGVRDLTCPSHFL